MKILMLSANTGEGHNSTARAMVEVLEQRGVECVIVDTLECLSPSISRFICNWHARLYKYAPKLWDRSYRAMEKNIGDSDEGMLVYEMLAMGVNKLKAILDNGFFDAVVCVHVFSGMMMTELRKSWGIRIPCFFVITDYTCSPYVDRCIMDGYFIPAEGLIPEFEAAGLPRQKLFPYGIPVRQEFYRTNDRQQMRKELDLPENGRVLLLMCGSMGCGPIAQMAESLAGELGPEDRLVAFCGRNEKVLESLSAVANPRMRVLGFTNLVDKYMDAADMIVTKPGGLSSTEAANKHLPMVFIDAVGGCEYRNFDFFLENGYAVGSRDPEEVLHLALGLMAQPDTLTAMRQSLTRAFHTNGAVEIVNAVMDAAKAFSEMEKAGEEQVLPGSKTEQNLRKAAESKRMMQVRLSELGERARRAQAEWIGRLMEQCARQQEIHAHVLLRVQSGISVREPERTGGSGPVDLEAITLEFVSLLQKNSTRLKMYAKTADKEGYPAAAGVFRSLAQIDDQQYQTLDALLNRCISPERKTWICTGCGWRYRSPEPAESCPVCGCKQGWQVPFLDTLPE